MLPATASSCLNTVPAAGVYRFAVIAVDRWGQSAAATRGADRCLGGHGAELGADLLRQFDERARGRAAVAVAVPDHGDRARRDVVELDDADALVLLVDGQPRDDGGAQAGGDHPLHRPVVVGAEDEAERFGREASSWFSPRQCQKADQVEPRSGGLRVVSGSSASAGRTST